MAMTAMTARSLSLLLLMLLAALVEKSDAKCAMTQTCVNPGNVPDYDACIPEAHAEPAEPQPVRTLAKCFFDSPCACVEDCWCSGC